MDMIQDMITAAQRFTKTYEEYEKAPIALREAMCLRALYPECFDDIGDDIFAGRKKDALVGYKFSFSDGDLGYYLNEKLIYNLRKNNRLTEQQETEIKELESFWRNRTVLSKLDFIFKTPDIPDEIINMLYLGSIEKDYVDFSFAANNIPRICEVSLNFDLLLKLGIPGMRDKIEQIRKSHEPKQDLSLFDGMLITIDVLIDCCLFYAKKAREMSQSADTGRSIELLEMACVLESITKAPPKNLREAIQLFRLYSQLACVDNYGRMDIYFGDFYCGDIDSGTITIDQAQYLINSLWKQIEETYPTSGRIIIGGKGRRNEVNANRFALAAMEASRLNKGVSPSLSLRLYRQQDPGLLDKALDTIGCGGTFPFLYNDDVLISSLGSLYKAAPDDAEQYVISNCGELTLDHRAITTPSASVLYLKLLELVLFDGYDHHSKQNMGRKTGGLDSFDSFEHLCDTFFGEVDYIIGLLVRYCGDIIKTTASESANLFCSLLFDDCIVNNSGLLSGARYLGLNIESHTIISAAQSLYTIKHLVYDESVFTPELLSQMLLKNFEGYENELKIIQSLPQYGNDIDEIDLFIKSISQKINAITYSYSGKYGFDLVVPSHISVDANVTLGKYAIASADGRLIGEPMSNSVNPISGRDKEGLTATLKSVSKIPADDSNGLVTHIKLSSEIFKHRDIIKSTINAFFKEGGSHLCISVLNINDLEDALIHPERHQNLMVRIGGFSARFISLSPEMQRDIINRTLHHFL